MKIEDTFSKYLGIQIYILELEKEECRNIAYKMHSPIISMAESIMN